MSDSVELRGFPQAEAELTALPGQLRRAMVDATQEASRVMVDTLKANTPVAGILKPRSRKGNLFPAGSLLRGWGSKITEKVDGAEGVVRNKVYYNLFVNRGAHPYKPMRADPYVARGVAEAMPTVEAIYDAYTAVTVEAAERA